LAVACFAAGPLACSNSSLDDDAVQGDPQALTECDASGVWAIKVSTPVTWPGSFVLQGGSGNVVNWLKTTRVANGNDIVDTAQICGAETPDYQATSTFGGEKYGVAFPEAMYATLPTFSLTGKLSSREVGASYSSPASAAVVGATLANPITDPWPSNVATLATADADGDGKPGVSGDIKQGDGHSNPPLNPFRTQRANRVYAAFRQVLASSTGTVKSCTRVEGTAKVAVINDKPAIDSHVVGCRREDGADCSAGEYKLLDSASPVYTPSGDAVVTMVKLEGSASAATCAEIRAMQF
jgi:hypothetical protein